MSNMFQDYYLDTLKLEDTLTKQKEALKFTIPLMGLEIIPTHNQYYFSFRFIVDGRETILSIEDAKRLADYLGQATYGIDAEHEIVKSILGKSNE